MFGVEGPVSVAGVPQVKISSLSSTRYDKVPTHPINHPCQVGSTAEYDQIH